MSDRLIRDLLLGFIKLHILHHAKEEPIYGQEFNRELKRHGYDFSFGTLYPIFYKLEEKGYLTSYQENVGGKIRKYYLITEKGEEVLKEAKIRAKELVDELFEE